MKMIADTKRTGLINTLAVLLAVIFAILIKSLLPADVNVEEFDSTLVNILGFPAVAVLYFAAIFLHCVLVMQYFGKKSSLTKFQIGFRFGMVFSALYLFGMQEVVVEASPFDEWGLPFVRYQFINGITDALPVFLLCLTTSYLTLYEKKTSDSIHFLNAVERIKVVTIVAITFLIQRAIGYETGIVGSNSATFPVPTYLWTMIFGIVLGTAYVFLFPLFSRGQFDPLQSFQIVVITIGINWILFNSFIGLIFQDVMGQMLLRTGIDVVVFYLTVIIIHKFFITPYRDQESDQYKK